MVASGIFGGPLPPERIARLGVRHADLLHTTALQQAEWMFLNVRRPPFDDVRVRRALNYAVDRRRIVEIAGGSRLAQPKCQILTPGLPGYEPGAPLDPTAAGIWTAPTSPKRELVAESGTRGTNVTVWTATEGERVPVARYFVSPARPARLRAQRQLPGNFEDRYYPAVADSRTGAQIGQLGWGLDYLRRRTSRPPSSARRSCRAARSRTATRQLRDPRIDAEIDAALAPSDADPASANATWAAVDRSWSTPRWSQCSTAAASRSSPNGPERAAAPGACYSTSSGSSSAPSTPTRSPTGASAADLVERMEWARSAPPRTNAIKLGPLVDDDRHQPGRAAEPKVRRSRLGASGKRSATRCSACSRTSSGSGGPSTVRVG